MSPDRYKYFRVEARELIDGLTQGALELERGGAAADTAAALLRLAHTLKGAARVVRQPRLAELAHAVEEVLEPYRSGAQPVPTAASAELLRLCDSLSAGLRELDAPPAMPGPSSPGASAPSAGDELLDTVRVEVGEVNSLLERLAEGDLHLGALRRLTSTVEDARRLAREGTSSVDALQACLERLGRGLEEGLERTGREWAQVRRRAERQRLTGAQALLPTLARSAHEAAREQGKRVECHLTGGQVRLEAQVWLRLRQALLHLVNNAVAHGLESPAERSAAGKSPAGRLELKVQRMGAEVEVCCRDDGAGLDLQAVQRVAAERGLVAAGQELTPAQAAELLLHGGLSTSAAVTEVSGRGVGLDVVRAAAESLKGQVRIESQPGRGTSVYLRFPVSLSAIPALLIEAGGVQAAVPVEAVRQVLSAQSAPLLLLEGRTSLAWSGRTLPCLALARALGQEAHSHSAAVVLVAGNAMAAVTVDRLLGVATVVMQRVPAEAAALPLVAGASLDTQGEVRLLLDPVALIAIAAETASDAPREAKSPDLAPILVVDDSLTTRMLEQSILEAAGYQVELACSAEEGLEKAAQRRYSLFLVDVEMPGLNGFEFIARTRADARLREVPAILVTSRNAAEDRRRGEQAGACAYLVKTEFDQKRLLAEIRRHVGRA